MAQILHGENHNYSPHLSWFPSSEELFLNFSKPFDISCSCFSALRLYILILSKYRYLCMPLKFLYTYSSVYSRPSSYLSTQSLMLFKHLRLSAICSSWKHSFSSSTWPDIDAYLERAPSHLLKRSSINFRSMKHLNLLRPLVVVVGIQPFNLYLPVSTVLV